MRLRFLLVAAALLAADAPAHAQTCTANLIPGSCTRTRSVSITIRRTVQVTITPSAAILPGPNSTDLLAGFSTALGHSILVKSTSPWQLHISSAQVLWTGSGGARANKPRADLLWSILPGSGFVPITGTAALMNSGTQTAGVTTNLYYRILWSWTLDTPGAYALPILIRVTAN